MSVCDPDGGMHHVWAGALPEQVFADAPPREFEPAYVEHLADVLARHAHEVAADIVEPVVQNAGGMRFHSPRYLQALRELADAHDVLLVCVGAFGELGVRAADRLTAQGIGVTVVDPRWVFPVPSALVDLAADHRLVVTVEDGGRHGGVGSAVARALGDAGIDVPVRSLGLEQEFLEHDKRAAILAAHGLTDQDVARRITEWVSVGNDAEGRRETERSGARPEEWVPEVVGIDRPAGRPRR
jgi:hypothetical protein